MSSMNVVELCTPTATEADAFLDLAVEVINRISEAERDPKSAVPKAILNCAECSLLLGALAALIIEKYEYAFSDPMVAIDLAATHYRSTH